MTDEETPRVSRIPAERAGRIKQAIQEKLEEHEVLLGRCRLGRLTFRVAAGDRIEVEFTPTV
jgi:hypothetical protein